MRKGFCGLAAAVLILAGSVLSAQAVDYTGKDGWEAEFTGDAIESNFTSKAFAEEIKSLQPGDSIEIKVAVKNSSRQGTDWYMSNEVLQSLEDSSPANGGAYTYKLTWKNGSSTAVLYDSENVGGDTITAAGEGLHEATDNLEQFFYLDHLRKGDAGSITLKVALNGETQGNNYQNTLARLQLNFAVEGTGTDGESGRTSHNTPVTYSPGAVKTGDPGRMLFWSLATLISGLAFLIAAVIYQKKSRGGDEIE